MHLLLISNSTNPGEEFLSYPKAELEKFCNGFSVKRAVFVPYAAVTFSYDEFERKVQNRFEEFGVSVESVHHHTDPVSAINSAECIIVGGGNTFMLVKMMQEQGLIDAIRAKTISGTPYIGWSAGSNVACPTLCTTNDMPIVQPESFKTLNLIPFQINPHYTDGHIEGHGGETREQRILEYIVANPSMYVAGLRESCMFHIDGDKISLIGPRTLRIFKHGQSALELSSTDDIQFLMQH